MTTPTKDQIVQLLYAWISQRPGLDFGNYGDVSAWRSEVRRIGRQLADARQLLRAVELSGISAEELAAAFPRAFSGRLTLESRSAGVLQWIDVSALPAGYPFASDTKFRLTYCAGQYWPTEYRAAACAVLASALWDYYREGFAASAKPGESPGDAIRRNFRREYGRSIQSRWFN